jgi:hypothetical protein
LTRPESDSGALCAFPNAEVSATKAVMCQPLTPEVSATCVSHCWADGRCESDSCSLVRLWGHGGKDNIVFGRGRCAMRATAILGRPHCIQGTKSNASQMWLSTTTVRHPAPTNCGRVDTVLTLENRPAEPTSSRHAGASAASALRHMAFMLTKFSRNPPQLARLGVASILWR